MGIIESTMAFLVVTFLFCGILCGFIAFSKDRSWLGFALAGMLLGPFGLLITGNVPPGGRDPHASGDDLPEQRHVDKR